MSTELVTTQKLLVKLPKNVDKPQEQLDLQYEQSLAALVALLVLRWRQDVFAQVVFHHLGGQAADRAAHGCDLAQHLDTGRIRLQGPLDAFELAFDATDTRDQLGFFTGGVGHGRG